MLPFLKRMISRSEPGHDLWIDAPDALERIAGHTTDPAMQAKLREFIETGVAIFEGAVSPDHIDRIGRDIESFRTEPERVVMKRAGKYIDPAEVEEMTPGCRMIDLHGRSAAARQAILCPPVASFLSLVFGEPAIAFQSLTFEYGSQQAVHQDTAYVVTQRPLSLAASWLALEDVVEGSGELVYYPGSHRFEPFSFSGQHKSWNAKRDGQEQHRTYLAQLHEQAERRGLELEAFLPKAGDILIWHADLAHGGSAIKDKQQTRRSLVTHFTPLSVKPRYQGVVGRTYYELPGPGGHRFTSRHYDLRTLSSVDDEKAARIYYDGGVTAG